MNRNALRAALLKFLDQDEVSASKFSLAQRQCLDPLCRTTPALEAFSKGRGLVYRVKDRAAFALHLYQVAPATDMALDESLPVRTRNIAQARSSKVGVSRHDTYYLLLRSPDHSLCWRSEAGSSVLALGQATLDYGAAVLQISPQDDWRGDGELWLVENQALFDRLDWLPHTTGVSVAYYKGQVTGHLLDWLAAWPRCPQVIHFPDYDGVGLANFARLNKALQGNVDFWLMPDWQAKLRLFGSNGLWRDTYRDFAASFAILPQVVRPLAEQMLQHGLALEQESVWL